MATIHILKPTPEQRTQPAVTARPTSAEIIFFPGVRYERWSDQQAIAPKTRKKRRNRVKRDRMTIAG